VHLLRDSDIALVCADTAGKWPVLDDVTSDMVYLRLHGDLELYVSGYGDAALDRWAAHVRTWQVGGTPTDGRALRPASTRAQARGVPSLRQMTLKLRPVRRDCARAPAWRPGSGGVGTGGRVIRPGRSHAGPPVPITHMTPVHLGDSDAPESIKASRRRQDLESGCSMIRVNQNTSTLAERPRRVTR
jgi:hypothetical protein